MNHPIWVVLFSVLSLIVAGLLGAATWIDRTMALAGHLGVTAIIIVALAVVLGVGIAIIEDA